MADNTGTSNSTYNLVSVLYHALQGADLYDDSSESTKVPDQQIPVENSPEIDDTEGHPT
jgi:hypothetical protein